MKFTIPILVATNWLLLGVAVWQDFFSLAPFDVATLIFIAALVSWAVWSSRVWLKSVVGLLLAVGSLVASLSLEPVLRSVGGHSNPAEASYLDGTKAYYNAIRAYRPYTILAAGGLFLIFMSAGRRDKSSS